MSLFNLDRFRFEKKAKMAEGNAPSPGLPADQEEAAASSSLDAVDKDASVSAASEGHAVIVDREDDVVIDHNSRPATPASDVSEKTDDSSVPETPEAKRTTQSSFFKYQKDVIELSSESEEEVVPAKYTHAKQPTAPRKDVIIISEPSESEEDVVKPVQSPHRNGPSQGSNLTKEDEDGEEEEEEEEEEDLNYCKLQTLKELFPQKSDKELLQVQ